MGRSLAVTGVTSDHRQPIRIELKRADAAFWKSPDMSQAFDGVAVVPLSQALLRSLFKLPTGSGKPAAALELGALLDPACNSAMISDEITGCQDRNRARHIFQGKGRPSRRGQATRGRASILSTLVPSPPERLAAALGCRLELLDAPHDLFVGHTRQALRVHQGRGGARVARRCRDSLRSAGPCVPRLRPGNSRRVSASAHTQHTRPPWSCTPALPITYVKRIFGPRRKRTMRNHHFVGRR